LLGQNFIKIYQLMLDHPMNNFVVSVLGDRMISKRLEKVAAFPFLWPTSTSAPHTEQQSVAASRLNLRERVPDNTSLASLPKSSP
jgi:hypothetical protein